MAIRIPAAPITPLLRRMITRSLAAVHAGTAVRRAVRRDGEILTVGSSRYDLRRYDRVAVVGAGKAAAQMAREMERLLGRRLHRGLVIVKHGHAIPTKRIVVEEAGHPVPDRAGLVATRRLRDLASSLSGRDLLIVLLSGGASSLLPAPVPGLTLADKQRVTRQLLRCGAGIAEINTVRKHLSMLKGGRLAESTKATVITLILSDVLGDDLSAIASGPTAPDPTTYGDAIAALHRCRIWSATPRSVRRQLRAGARGRFGETPKPGSGIFKRVQNIIVGNNQSALSALTSVARQAGFRTILHSARVTGEARVEGAKFGALARGLFGRGARASKPCCLVAGGETTVTVRGAGAGGRAQEFAVGAATAIAGLPDVWVAAIGSDGTDGPTDVAGALVSGGTRARAHRLGVDLDNALRRNDTFAALKRLRCHIKTGPTGTNVNDLYLLFVL